MGSQPSPPYRSCSPEFATSARAVDTEAHQRTITLGLAGRYAFGQVTGTVNDSYRACSAEVPVTIQRFRAGSWRWVATTTTRKDGTYRVRVRAPRGTYRAVANEGPLSRTARRAHPVSRTCVWVCGLRRGRISGR